VRTTVNLPDPLIVQARRRASETGRTLTAFVADAVRETVARRREGPNQPPVRLTTSGGSGLQPGVDLDDSAAAQHLMDETDAADVAALALESGCEWVTTDRNYSRFPGLARRHPLKPGPGTGAPA
jgi:hypothetical protein